jgi:hypothetical protein
MPLLIAKDVFLNDEYDSDDEEDEEWENDQDTLSWIKLIKEPGENWFSNNWTYDGEDESMDSEDSMPVLMDPNNGDQDDSSDDDSEDKDNIYSFVDAHRMSWKKLQEEHEEECYAAGGGNSEAILMDTGSMCHKFVEEQFSN